jgi:putative sigma-54 modulation protein
MKLEIQSIHFDADKKLLAYIEKKLNKLETFYDGIVNGEVFLKLTNDVTGNKLIEVKLNVNNQTLFVKEQSRTFEASCDMAESSLKAQLIKYKQRSRQAY